MCLNNGAFHCWAVFVVVLRRLDSTFPAFHAGLHRGAVSRARPNASLVARIWDTCGLARRTDAIVVD